MFASEWLPTFLGWDCLPTGYLQQVSSFFRLFPPVLFAGAICHTDQVQCGDNVLALRVRAFDSAVAALAEAAGSFRPAKDLLDALADFLAGAVRGSEKDMQSFLTILARRMRYDAVLAFSGHKLLGVVARVPSDRLGFEAPVLQLYHLVDRHRGFRAPTAGLMSNNTHSPLRLSIVA